MAADGRHLPMAHPKQITHKRVFSPLSSTVIAFSIALPSALMLLPGRSVWAVWPAVLLLSAAIWMRSLAAVHVSLFCFLFTCFAAFLPILRFWPWPLLAPLVVFHLVVLSVPRLRKSCLWLKPGRITESVLILMLVVATGSVLALIGWYEAMEPDLSIHLRRFPDIPPHLIPLAGIGFALLNAVMEEFTFRGIFMHGLDCAFDNEALSIVLQGLSFGLFHYVGGFPNAGIGTLMAFIFGILLGWIRNRSNGLMAPVVTHVIADSAIFWILAMAFMHSGA